MLDRWGSFTSRRPLAVLLVGVFSAIAAAAYGFGVFPSLSQGGFDDPKSESAQELRLEQTKLGNQGIDALVLYTNDEFTAYDPEFIDPIKAALADLPADTVSKIVTWDTAGDTAGKNPRLVSADQHTAQVQISLAGVTQDDFVKNYREIEDKLAVAGFDTQIAGPYAVYSDVNHRTESDLKRAELISMPIVVILALLIFGSAVAALMPAMVGVVAMVGALAAVRLITHVTDVSIFAVNVISLLGIGLAIDYALFVISRFREELARLDRNDPEGPQKAIRATMNTAGRTVLFSGLTVAASLSSLLIFPQMFLRSMGYGGMGAVLVAMVAALTILPATLTLLGHRVDAGRLPWRRGKAMVDDEHGRWAALAHAVMRRPLLVTLGTVALLLVVASPFLGAKWGSVDYRVLPNDEPSHIAAETLNETFAPETSTANVLLQSTDPGDVEAYVASVRAAVPEIVGVEPVTSQGDLTLLRAAWVGNSQSEASQQIVKDLRQVDPPSGSVLVGGLTADTVDLVSSVGAHLPWMGLIVIGVMMLLLFIAFGSVVLPVKAVLMNMVSITASFGVVSWIFSDGHLSGLLGFESQGFMDATNPILMLAILFGLSMDYEVFLLSRVREEWDRSHDNDRAVAAGVQKTGRIITSAAVLLAVVIGAFATSGIVFMKMLGVGMLVALLVDATIVRALLVPATMKMLGTLNWWAPGPLRRWWEKYGFREA